MTLKNEDKTIIRKRPDNKIEIKINGCIFVFRKITKQ